MSMIETVLTVLKDRFPILRERKWLLALGVCALFFALGLPLTTNVSYTNLFPFQYLLNFCCNVISKVCMCFFVGGFRNINDIFRKL